MQCRVAMRGLRRHSFALALALLKAPLGLVPILALSVRLASGDRLLVHVFLGFALKSG